MTTTHRAACSCGEIAVTVTGTPAFQAICACKDCQSRTGSAFGMSVYFPRENVVQFEGTPKVYRRTSNKGRWLDFRFCPTCGTSVWWLMELNRNNIGIAGILLDGFEFEADFAVFCQSQPGFVTFNTDKPQYQRGSSDG